MSLTDAVVRSVRQHRQMRSVGSDQNEQDQAGKSPERARGRNWRAEVSSPSSISDGTVDRHSLHVSEYRSQAAALSVISTEPINTSDEEPTAQFLLVGLVIMRGTATLCSLKISLPPQVATLLVVLLSHLAFMASPLHARLVAEVSHGVDMTVMAAGEGSPAIGRQPLPGGHDGHCIIEWLKADQRIAQAIFFAIGGDAVILIPDLLIPGRRPVARALGPPATGDPQALLQVFRL